MAALGVARPLHAQALSYRITPEPVADGVWVVRGTDEPIRRENGGAIANVGIVRTGAGAVLIDCGPSRRYGEALRAVAERLAGPVQRVYLTHLHPDHVYASGVFPAGVVAALPAGIADLKANGPGYSDGLYRLLGDWMRGTEFRLPDVTLEGGSEAFGGRRLRLLALSGHSASDLAVLDEASGTLFAGDLVFHDRAPSTPNAELGGWRRSLGVLRGAGQARVVPGHGPVDPGPVAAIGQTEDWLAWLETALTSAAQAGLDMVEAGQMPIPARFAALKAARYELQRSVSHLYPAIESRVLGSPQRAQ